MIAMVTSLSNETKDMLLITNLFNKFPMYTTNKVGDSQTLSNDENLKYILNYAVKYNITRILIYFNINNLKFKTSFKHEIFEDTSEDPFPTSGPTLGSGNGNPGIGPKKKNPIYQPFAKFG